MHTSPRRKRPDGPLRVLHLVLSFAPGGRRDAITTLASASRDLEVESHLVSLHEAPGAENRVPEAFHHATLIGAAGLPNLAHGRALSRYCKEHSIDIVHAHDASSQFAASVLRLVAPEQRSVMTFHRSLPIDVVGLRNRIRNTISLPLISRVITASQERRAFFLRHNWISGQRVRTIALGIDTARFFPNQGDGQALRSELGIGPLEFVTLSVGHFNLEKGLDQGLEVVGELARRMPDVSFRHIVLGRGTAERAEVLGRLAEEALPGRVLFAGYRPDPERWYNAADLLLHTPRLEAFGLVLPQAMACGTPVAAYEIGGIPEIVEKGVSGVTAAGGDTAALAEAIRGLVVDRSLRAAVGKEAEESANRRYGADRYARDHLDLYEEVLASRKDRPESRR